MSVIWIWSLIHDELSTTWVAAEAEPNAYLISMTIFLAHSPGGWCSGRELKLGAPNCLVHFFNRFRVQVGRYAVS